ncbi:MAG: UDP-glucose/GDP-mannose dehydrogenase family protein, partial [Phycisphaerae bacterium]|nr:UDP-glucose/GDP-mannose dehydrogenase family protein [Phycisphaerae bacterium]
MRIGVIGSGYVGLVTAACFADSGNDVTAVDKDAAKVVELSSGRCTIYEPGLEELMRMSMAAERLRFSTRIADAVADAEVVFLAVGTPPRADGSADLSAVEAVAEAVGKAMTGPLVVVNKSTVPVGTGARVAEILRANTNHPFQVVSNPEFLKEGSALDDFLRPDRVVIGADDADAADLLVELYKPFVRNNRPILVMSRIAAEMSKYASNAYLSTRISFINEIAEICERLGIDVNEVRRGMGADARIGHHFLYPGVGYGGSCFPKDVQALASTGRSAGASCELLESVHNRNERQRTRMIERIRERLGADLSGKHIAVWGIAFKPKTDDVREAPAINVIGAMIESGAAVSTYDPEALENARQIFGERVTYCQRAYEA